MSKELAIIIVYYIVVIVLGFYHQWLTILGFAGGYAVGRLQQMFREVKS